jgi:hypothetical protein
MKLANLTGCAAALAATAALVMSGCAQPQPPKEGAVLAQQIEHLSAEVARLQDVSDIKRLQRAWSYFIETAQWDQAADLFAGEASIEMGLDGVYRGKARIRDYLHALGGGHVGLSPGELNEQLLLQPVIDVADDGLTAKGRWRRLMMRGQHGSSASWGEGPFEIGYVREHGAWKILSLHWYQTYVVPYQGGWAASRDLNGAKYVAAILPPDAPPTEDYPTWPAVYRPAYHYPNPTRAAPPAPAPAADVSAGDPATAGLQQAVAALQQHADRLRDAQAIENLVSIYGYYLDKQQWEDLTALFADDGKMEISLRGIYVGHASIRRALELFGPQNIEPAHLHNHIQVQPEIDVAPDGQHAWSRTRAISQLSTFGTVGVWGDGVYENEYVKVSGIWRIATDHIYTGFFATYEGGWLNAARAAPGVSPKIPPDLPTSEHYQSYPEVYIPPFHYVNPVTGRPVGEGYAANASVAAPVGAAAARAAQIPASGPAHEREALRRIEHAITRLADESAIEKLQRSFGFFTDKALWKDASDLFTDDGTLELGGGGVYAGRARVREYLTSLAPQGLQHGWMYNYVQEQPIITIAADGRTARGRWKFLAELGEWQKSAVWGVGVYENKYVKVDGVWRIRSIHRYDRMLTPYVDGWAKTALPLAGPSARVPPDRPPTVSYQPYPGSFAPPLDLASPVAGRK